MSLTLDETENIARLARLDLGSPEEAEATARRLGAIVDYFDQLASFEADDAPDAFAETVFSGEAEDLVAPCLERQTFLDNAPRSRDGFLVVPKIKTDPDAP